MKKFMLLPAVALLLISGCGKIQEKVNQKIEQKVDEKVDESIKKLEQELDKSSKMLDSIKTESLGGMDSIKYQLDSVNANVKELIEKQKIKIEQKKKELGQ